MKINKTNRGFHIARFIDIDRNTCSIQESSAMERPLLWLGINDPNPKILPGNGTGWHDYPLPENVLCTTRMHLTQKQAKALIPLLQTFVKKGKLK